MQYSFVLSALALTACSIASPLNFLKRDNCETTYSTITSSGCPIWTMTFTNEYNVPAGETGDLVTATYTDTNNCAATTSVSTEVNCPTTCSTITQTSVSSSCPIWTMTFTNEYNIPPGQTGDLVTATYTDTANCAPATTVYSTETKC